jgi:glyoxylase-like metal-dependent hydrolase (beta-lactamase superfamily II)/rhodanese-related sulfurtransferase
MFLQQIFVKGLAHSSYLLGASETCAIVDPRRDVDIYLDAAKEMGMRVTHILETHLHADFVSGHMDLAERTGATIVAPKAGECRFKHLAVAEGDVFEIEDLALRVLDTPGHTPEHVSYVVVDKARGAEPVCVFTGDTLFVGDVGRPDLFPGIAAELASKLYDSLHAKLLKLPDGCEVLPAHGAGSLCGRSMGAKRTSTIGYERLYNRAILVKGRAEFIRSLTTHMPPAPDHFSRCSAINGAGPTLVADLPPLAALPPGEFAGRAKRKDAIVLDVRAYDAFGGQHVPRAWHIDVAGNFSTFSGWVLPPDRDILIVATRAEQAEEAALLLRRVGLDRAVGWLEGSMFEWAKAGLPAAHVPQLSPVEFQAMAKTQKLTLVDVRAVGEYRKSHIEGAVNIPAPDLRARFVELPKDVPLVTVCSTGHRSSMAASILQQHGFDDVRNLAGGMTGYAASFPM